MPLVSVIVPTYNGEAYIGDCLSSILDQDHPRIEVLVVDDGSTDGTEAVVQRFGPQVRYFRQPNSGSAVARNRGLDEARGELIAFCDSDDLWTPGRLAQQVAFLQSQQHFHAVCGAFREIPADFALASAAQFRPEGSAALDPKRSGWAYHWLLRDSLYHLDALLVRRDVLAQVRFEPHFRRGQDFDFFLQLAQATPIAQLTAVYALYRQHGGSITRQPHLRNYRAEVIDRAIARWGLTCPDGTEMKQGELATLLARTWFSHGWDLYHARWYVEAARAFQRSSEYMPSFGASRYRWQSALLKPFDRRPRPASPG
jgi:glycosyltransferase involved in cell wall biosynthesis